MSKLNRLHRNWWNAVDARVTRSTRTLAQTVSRRGFIGRLGTLLVGAGAIPLLPVTREAAAATQIPEMGDPQSCDYWRYCAFGGNLCSCCGGSHTTCPPGSELSPITWLGTCRNPADGKHYVISYNDCCGKSSCGNCLCQRNENDRPIYRPSVSNDLNWCLGTSNNTYHCSMARVIGTALEQPDA